MKYLNERIRADVVKKLRKYERKNKLPASISGTIEQLLIKAELYDQQTFESKGYL